MIVAALVTSLILNVVLLVLGWRSNDRWEEERVRGVVLHNSLGNAALEIEELKKRLEPFKAYEDQVSR